MKKIKHRKTILIVSGVILAIILCIGGIYIGCQKIKEEIVTESQNEQQEEKMEMIKIAKDHQKEMDEEVRYGDKDHHIKSITYEWNTVEKNPMDGFMLNGYVNNDKKLDFGIQFDSDNGKIEPRMYRCKPIIASWEGLDR